MNAETRAEELWVAMLEADPSVVADNPAVEALILQAIASAENDKMEEAAQCVRDNCLPAECHYALEAISALKHED